MILKEIAQHKYLKNEIKQLKRKLKELKSYIGKFYSYKKYQLKTLIHKKKVDYDQSKVAEPKFT